VYLMEPHEFLKELHFEDILKQVHLKITRKCPLEDQRFDAWYTNNDAVMLKLRDIGQNLALEIRTKCNIVWSKGSFPCDLYKVLDKHGRAPKDWEDSPDGALAGLD